MFKVRPLLSWISPRNQLRPTLARHIVPAPLQEHEELIVKPDQIVYVHQQPGHPGQESIQMEAAEICDPGVAPDNRQIAFIDIAESGRGFALQSPADRLADIAALLNGD